MCDRERQLGGPRGPGRDNARWSKVMAGTEVELQALRDPGPQSRELAVAVTPG